MTGIFSAAAVSTFTARNRPLKGIAAAIALAAPMAFNPAAWAGVVDNTSLAAPGLYFGTGNSGQNFGFTVSTDNGVELGLDAITRYVGGITPTTGNLYNVPTGPTSIGGKTGAVWGFDFSINTHPGGTAGDGTLTLGDITATLTLYDAGTHTTGSFDLFAIPDNAEYGPAGTFGGKAGCSALGASCGPGQWGVQNSEALSFSSIAAAFGDPSFDLNADDTYLITLSAFNKSTGGELATDTIEVVAGTGAVPEPGSLYLLASGLLSLGAFRRWRKTR